MLKAAINPFLKRIISLIDKECPRDRNLLLNSLKDFLGDPISLCPTRKSVSTKMARPFYRLGSMLNDSFEEIWDTHPLLWKLRVREDLEDCSIGGEKVGCGECPDKYICGGCSARAYSYFNGNVKMPDAGCIHNETLGKDI